jgi:hypothetical protein
LGFRLHVGITYLRFLSERDQGLRQFTIEPPFAHPR